jgi:dUTP pyrophosphatase
MFTFEVYELYIYFGFMQTSLQDEYSDKIYKKYRQNIIKNNKNIGKYIYDIANSSYSDVTFDSGFDIFNISNENILGKQTSLVDFNINCCMKLKKYISKYINSDYDRNLDYRELDYNFEETSGLDNYISYLNKNINFEITNNFQAYSGYYLYPRSSMGAKTPLRCANSVGIIDSGYRGNIKGCLTNMNELEFQLIREERYMQLCPGNISYPVFVKEVFSLQELGETNRGIGGFGSTGK